MRNAETLTDEEFADRVGITPNQWASAARRGAPSVRTKQGSRRPWPETLHWYIQLREQDARGAMPTTVQQSDFASLVGVTDRQIRNLLQNGLPADVDSKRRRIPLAEGIRWWIEYKLKQTNGEERSDLDQEKLRKLRADAALSEFALAEKRASLIGVDVVANEMEELFASIQSVLRAFPDRAAKRVLGLEKLPELRKVLTEEVQEADARCIDAARAWAARAAKAVLAADHDEDDEVGGDRDLD